MVWAKAERNVRLVGTIQNSPLLHICFPPPATALKSKSHPRLLSACWTHSISKTLEMLPLSWALRPTPLYSHGHCRPFLNLTTRKAYLKHLPSLTHFPMHCQGDLSKSKFDSISPFHITFLELQITYRVKSKTLKTFGGFFMVPHPPAFPASWLLPSTIGNTWNSRLSSYPLCLPASSAPGPTISSLQRSPILLHSCVCTSIIALTAMAGSTEPTSPQPKHASYSFFASQHLILQLQKY